MDTRNRFIAVVIVSVLLGYLAIGSLGVVKNWPMPAFLRNLKIKPGIDLAGGAELRYRILTQLAIDPERVKDRTKVGQAVVDALGRRINLRGLKEPRITTHADDFVVIQLAGVDRDEMEDYKRLISEVGDLALKEVAGPEVHERYNADKIVPDGYEALPAPREAGGGGGMILVKKDVNIITGPDIKAATHEQDYRGQRGWRVTFELHDEGAREFDKAARRLAVQNPKGRIAIIIDRTVMSAPAVQSEEFGGRGEITGSFSEKEAKDLGIVLRSGSLPCPIGKIEDGTPKEKVPESENFIGPSLGQDAIMRGLLASIATFLGVAVFMIVYYRAGGVIAVVTLVLNGIYLFAIMALFQATLTLPGIAGMALTIGMAVDANILIYERMREELAKGKTLTQAFEAGHDRAFVTIIDSNLTTLLAAVVLYYFGSGPVQGFAVTLSVGIITTLVSVLVCGKTILQMLIQRGSLRELRMMKILSSPNYQFVKYVRPAVLGSVVLIVATMAVFFVRGQNNFGIDFRGGSLLNFSFTKSKDINEVRQRTRSIPDPETKRPRYPDAEIQTVAEPGASLKDVKIIQGASRQFQLRDQAQDVAQLRNDVQEEFKNELSHVPFVEIRPTDEKLKHEISDNPREFPCGPAGAGLFVYFRKDAAFDKFEEVKKKLMEATRGILVQDVEPHMSISDPLPDAPEGLVKLKLQICKVEYDSRAGGDQLTKLREAIKTMAVSGAFTLSTDPFLAQGNIGPAVAAEAMNKSILAMIASWVLMIAYIAIRFSSWRFGVAAVIALIHDALVSIGTVAVLGAVVPKSWGLSFDMNMTFVAAILTVIGFSINDTIVIFDRIRENLALMKKESFSEIINVSVNQTLSRTILTALTVWITVIVLYVSTMTSGGGIAEFSLPLIIGVLAGAYSTVYIASPIVLWWYRGQKPQMA